MAAELPNVHLNLLNRPENVLLVRQVLSGVADAIQLSADDLNDVSTAVTEACNNVVLHAYGGGEGPLEVEIYDASPETLEVVVRDHGVGIQPRIRTAGGVASGIGLPIIQALVRQLELSGTPDDGTEVRMEFATPGTRPLERLEEAAQTLLLGAHSELFTARELVGVAIAPPRLVRTVLPRVLGVLAARADFSTDRIADAQLVADTLSTRSAEAIGTSYLHMRVGVERRALELGIGPLREGLAQRLIVDHALDGASSVIETLADDRRVVTVKDAEVLLLRMVDQR
jgi:serine/threonine-protein kinase RsbW